MHTALRVEEVFERQAESLLRGRRAGVEKHESPSSLRPAEREREKKEEEKRDTYIVRATSLLCFLPAVHVLSNLFTVPRCTVTASSSSSSLRVLSRRIRYVEGSAAVQKSSEHTDLHAVCLPSLQGSHPPPRPPVSRTQASPIHIYVSTRIYGRLSLSPSI